MAERARLHERGARTLLAFALGTFNASILLLALLGFAHARGTLGDLLSGQSRALGLALFALLWALACGASEAALRRLPLDPPPAWIAVAAWAMCGGGTAGAVVAIPAVLLGAAVAILGGGAVGEVALSLVLLLLYGAAAAGVAFLVGAAAGLVLGTLNRALLSVALLAGPTGEPSRRRSDRGPTRDEGAGR